MSASKPESGPQAITAASVAIVPRVVSTPVNRPPTMRNPVTPQLTATGTPDPAAKPIVICFGSRKPSPCRKRACTTFSATYGKR